MRSVWSRVRTGSTSVVRPLPADIPEQPRPGEAAADYALRMAREKAQAAWQRSGSSLPVLGAVFASRALGRMRKRMDPGAVNGGPLLGLNGIVVKSHGGADANGYAAAIRVAADLARSDFAAEIDRNMKRLTAVISECAAPSAEGAV